MAEPAPAAALPDNKKRKLITSFNDNNDHKEAPILFLNVGGAKRNVRRSLWNALRDASCGRKTNPSSSLGREGEEEVVAVGNPLCDLVLMGAEHWSDVPTTSDEDGTIRIYLDRNPQAMDDLLEYIEYGKVFLEGIVGKDNDRNGARLKRLQMECDYFTVDGLSEDVDEVLFGEAVSFRYDDWFSNAGNCVWNAEEELVGWNWRKICGNESIATRGSSLSICDVKTTGTYLMFFSLYSVAVTALSPTEFYPIERNDEFVRVEVIHEVMTQRNHGHWTYPLARCGAFDYRDNDETRRNEPLLFTAAFAEPVSLKKGNRLYCAHGTGVIHPAGSPIQNSVTEHSEFDEEEPHCVNFITLVQVFGDSMSKWSVASDKNPKSEPSVVKWVPAHNDFPTRTTSLGAAARLDENDETKIRFNKAGYYLLLGRVAGGLKKNYSYQELERMGSVQLELRTNGGLPLHTIPDVVSYPRLSQLELDEEPYSYNKKMVEYGPINDIIYAESNSYISVRATGGLVLRGMGQHPAQQLRRYLRRV